MATPRLVSVLPVGASPNSGVQTELIDGILIVESMEFLGFGAPSPSPPVAAWSTDRARRESDFS